MFPEPDSLSADLSDEDGLFLVEYYRDRPAELYEKIFGAKPWEKQVQILEAVFKYPEVAVKSCHGSGKSWNAARIALTFLLTHPGCTVITTAPTWRQVENIIWRELRSAYHKAYEELGGHITKTKLEMDDDWFAMGLSTNDPDAFQGFHSDEVLVIVDEAAGIEENIYEGVRAITSNKNAHVLYIGNPTTLSGTFYKAFSNPLVKKFTISAFDTPNFTDNGIYKLEDLIELFTPPQGADPLEYLTHVSTNMSLAYPALVSPTWTYQRWLEWGTDTAMWLARVAGEFPNQANDALLSLQGVMECMDKKNFGQELRQEFPDRYSIMPGPPAFGTDVAREGDDRTVIYERHGGTVLPAVVLRKQDELLVANRLLELIDRTNWNTSVRIDDTGVGGGVTTILKHAISTNNLHFHLVPINFGSGSIEGKRVKMLVQQQSKGVRPVEDKKAVFANRRAEMFWNLRELINNKQIWLPDDEELANELASIRYTHTKDQQIIIEPKKDMKKRTGKSPDKADALAVCCANLKPKKFADRVDTNKLVNEARRKAIQPTITGGIMKQHQDPTVYRRPRTTSTVMGGMRQRY